MSALSGGGPSLTESIFGPPSPSASAPPPSDGWGGLFAAPATAPAPKRPRRAAPSPPILPPGAEGPGNRDGEEGGDASPLIEAILDRRRRRSRPEVLGELTVSLEDYVGGAGGGTEELCADVRGLLRHHGVAIVRGALSDAEVDAVSNVADRTERRVRAALEERGIPYDDPVNDEEATCFAELAIRCRGRMDVRHCDATAGDGALPPLSLVDDLAASALHGAEPPVRVYAGWILSYSGSSDQPWHQDGAPLFGRGTGSLPCYALNAFVGLHDEDRAAELGPTELVPGSHRAEPADAAEGIDDAVVAATLGRGDVLLYDYRVCHRGTSNVTDARTAGDGTEGGDGDDGGGIVRKVLYLMYARPWFREHLNFGGESLFAQG